MTTGDVSDSPVAFDDLAAGDGLELLLHLERQRGAAGQAEPQRRQIVALDLGWLMMALSSVGTHGMIVGFSRSMSFNASSSEKRGMMMICAARADGDVHHDRQREDVEERQHAEHALGAAAPRSGLQAATCWVFT